MGIPDMSDVEPARQAEIRRRIRLVTSYIGGPRTAARRTAAADELGISTGQFLRLVRAWRETGSAATMQGAGSSSEARRPTRSLEPAVEGAMQGTLDELGPSARFVEVQREVTRRCALLRMDPPSGSTIHMRLNRRRAVYASPEGDASITIARCFLSLPVVIAGQPTRPMALLAVLMPEGTVVAAEIGFEGGREPDISRLVRRLKRMSKPAAPSRSVLAQTALTKGGASMVVERVTLRRCPAASTIISSAFGQRLGRLRLTTAARSDRSLRRLAAARLNNALTPVEASAALIDAVRTHNMGASRAVPTFRLA